MERRIISIETYNKIIDQIPQSVIDMLPDDPLKLLKYASRLVNINISSSIDEDTKEKMKEYLLTDEEYLRTFYYVMAISFWNKFPVQKPNLTIVTAQTGSGKSNLTAKILRKNSNYVFVDSDKYKHFRYDAIKISNEFPLLYPFLTGPDGYDHADNIYSYAVENKYNIIKETAPSHNKGLLGVDLELLLKNNYTVALNVLAVSGLNSSLSMHERYELQILSGLKTAKLTNLNRHNESYDSLIPNIEKLIEENAIQSINIYKRGDINNNFNPILIYPSNNYTSPIEAINQERKNDTKKTEEEIDARYNLLIEQMNNRQALDKQFEQLKTIKNN